jgi:hypothetical protein
MKFRHAFIFFPCLIVSLWSALTPARAVTHITSADTLTVSLSALPATTYTQINFQLNFTNFGGINGPDLLDVGESFRVNLLTSGNALLGQQTLNGPALAISGGIVGSVDNTGHLFIDQIVGSFDLHSIFVIGFVGTLPTQLFTVSFEVGAAPAVPLPAALPLFATGLGALGLFGWRRKKKAAALAA